MKTIDEVAKELGCLWYHINYLVKTRNVDVRRYGNMRLFSDENVETLRHLLATKQKRRVKLVEEE